MLRGTEIKPGQPLPVAAGERCELGDGLSGTAFLVDWQGDGGRDILYSLLPNMHGGGVYLYRERRADRAEVPLYDPPEPLAEVTGYHALPLVTHEGQLHLLTFGNPTRVPERESDPGWLKLYRNRGPRTAPRFAGPAERVSVDGKALAEVFAAADLWNLNPYRDGSGVTHLVISCLYEYVVEYWPDVRGTDLRDYPDMGPGAAIAPTAPGWAAGRPRGCSCCATPAVTTSPSTGRRSCWPSIAPGTAAPMPPWSTSTATAPSSCWCGGTWTGSTPCA